MASFCHHPARVGSEALTLSHDRMQQKHHSEGTFSMKKESKPRGLSWALMMTIVIVAMLIAVGLAYLVLKRNFPAGH
jgi:hypothetical protein